MLNTDKYVSVYSEFDCSASVENIERQHCYSLIGQYADGRCVDIANNLTQGNADMFVIIIGKTGVLPFLN